MTTPATDAELAQAYNQGYADGRKSMLPVDNRPHFYSCGICEHYHAIDFDGDCRQDNARFTYIDLDHKYGIMGWVEDEQPD